MLIICCEFEFQIIGGAVLHDGSIAEMKTGEKKALVLTLTTYFNALTGEGVHGMPCFILRFFFSFCVRK